MRMPLVYGLMFFLLGALLRQAPAGAAPRPTPPRTSAAGGRNAAASDILDLERAAWQAYKDKDAGGYRRLLAADYVNVGGDGIFGLEKELRDMASAGVDSFRLSDMKVLFPAPNTAVVTYVVWVARVGEPRREAALFYDASVWVHREGTWKTVLHTHAKKEH